MAGDSTGDAMVTEDDPILEQRRRRESRATRSVAAGVLFQGTYVAAQFVILAVLFRALGAERFGMWVTVFGLTMWLNLLPLGMNRALLTWLGGAAFHQPTIVWRVIESALVVVAIMSGAATVLILLLGGYVPWARVLNVTGASAVAQAGPTAVAALAMMAASMPAALGGMVLQALQRGTARHMLGVAAQAIGVGLLLVGVWQGWSLPALGVVIVSPVLIAGLLHWAAAWRWLPPQPARSLHPQRLVGPMLATGIGLWLVEVALVLMVNSGPLLVAQAGGAADVAPYAAVYRLVGPIVATYLVAGQAYWPAFGDAAAAKDHAWIGRALARSGLVFVGIWLAGAVVCMAVGRLFIRWWLGPEAEPGMGLILSGLGLALAHGCYHWTTAALSGMGYVRVQARGAVAALVLYGIGAWLAWKGLNAAGVFGLQAGGVGVIAVVNGGYLWRVMTARGTE